MATDDREPVVLDPVIDEDLRCALPPRVKVGDRILTMANLLDLGEGVDMENKPVMIVQQMTGEYEGLFSPLTVAAAKEVIAALQEFVDDHTPKETIN